jgi:Transposase, Mutator family
LDARYEKVREDGIIRSQAVLLAIGINRSVSQERTVVGGQRARAIAWGIWPMPTAIDQVYMKM